MAFSDNGYRTAIAVTKLVAFVGWLSVFAGIAVLVWTGLVLGGFIYSHLGGIVIAGWPVALAAVFIGLMLVLFGQSSRASLDTAMYSKEMLELMKAKS